VTAIGTVGFVGLGNMGRPMSRNLAAAGFGLVVRDIDLERQAEIAAELGCAAAGAPAGLSGCETVVTMLPTGRDVRSVMLEWEGGLALALRPGTVVVDMSSSDPTGTRELGAALAEHDVALVDAPVSGGVPRAEAGTLAIMVGGDDEGAIEKVRPLFETMGEHVFRTGPLGSGHAMKALNNFIAAACYTAAAEAVLIAARFGLDPAVLVDVLNASTGRSFNTEVNFPRNVLPRTFASGFALGLLAKDVGIASDLADAVRVDAPLSRLIAALWREAAEAEGPLRDHTEAIKHWERANGIELPAIQPADA
jgi:3-hydroxyisobutyrate dehydrogenase